MGTMQAAPQTWQLRQKVQQQEDDRASSDSAVSTTAARQQQWYMQHTTTLICSPRSDSSLESEDTTGRHSGDSAAAEERAISERNDQSPSRSSSRIRKRRSSGTLVHSDAGVARAAERQQAMLSSEQAVAAITEARRKAARALRLVAVAQHLARREAAAPVPVPRRRAARRAISFAVDSTSSDDEEPSASEDASQASELDEDLDQSPRKRRARGGLHPLLGARVAVLRDVCDSSPTFYKGEVTEVNARLGQCRIEYDAGAEEWTALQQRDFRWLGPRAASAGCSLAMKAGMAQASALNLVAEVAAPVRASTPPPSGVAAIGGRVLVHFAGDGRQHVAWVLAYDRETRRHHLLYEDGEDEWADLALDALEWSSALPGAPPAHGGLPPGSDSPDGEAAVGWQLKVYWKEDGLFYTARCIAYDAAAGTHALQYEDGESERLVLREEALKWLQLPTAEQPEAAWAASPLLCSGPGHLWPSASDAGADYKPLALAAQGWAVPATIPPAAPPQGLSKAGPDCETDRAASPALITSRLLGPCSLPGRSGSPRLPFTSGTWDNTIRAAQPSRLAVGSAAPPPLPNLRSVSEATAGSRSAVPKANGGTPPTTTHDRSMLPDSEHKGAEYGAGICDILCEGPDEELDESLCGSPPTVTGLGPMTHNGKGLLATFRSISTPGPPPLAAPLLPPHRSISMPSLAHAIDCASPVGAAAAGWSADTSGCASALDEPLDLSPADASYGLDLEPDLEGLLHSFMD